MSNQGKYNMPNDRKSFVLYKDSLEILDDLTDEQAGKLFKAIRSYQTGEEIELDPITKIAFTPFRTHFVRDDEKYQKIVERNKNNGSKGGRPKNPEEPKKPSGLNGNPNEPKKADSDIVIGIDSDIATKENKPAKLSKFSQDDLDCAHWFYGLLKQLNPNHKEPNFEKWADEIRKIVNIDKRSYNEISDLMLWVNQDNFWQTNVLSPSKLRDKWDQLTIAKNKTKSTNRTQQRTESNLQAARDFLSE